MGSRAWCVVGEPARAGVDHPTRQSGSLEPASQGYDAPDERGRAYRRIYRRGSPTRPACGPASQLSAWSRLPRLIALTSRDRDILERAGRNGIGDGFTVPAHSPGESAGSCSFATAPGQTAGADRLCLAQLVGGLAFEAARRLVALPRTPANKPTLTDRRRDCIYWAARGKSDWEIRTCVAAFSRPGLDIRGGHSGRSGYREAAATRR